MKLKAINNTNNSKLFDEIISSGLDKDEFLVKDFDDPSNFIGLSVERVNEIIALNKLGEKPEDINVKKEVPKIKLPDFENVVGQDSLTRFDNTKKKKKKKKKKPNGGLQSAGTPQPNSNDKQANAGEVQKPTPVAEKNVIKEHKGPNQQVKRPNPNNNNRNRNNNNRPPKPQSEG